MIERPRVNSLDHLVLTVSDLNRTVDFYARVLGCEARSFTGADGVARQALQFGTQKINLHLSGAEISPHARRPTPGSADLCFLSAVPLERWQDHLRAREVPTLSGIVARSGAAGPIRSIYLADPDGNLIEISNRA